MSSIVFGSDLWLAPVVLCTSDLCFYQLLDAPRLIATSLNRIRICGKAVGAPDVVGHMLTLHTHTHNVLLSSHVGWISPAVTHSTQQARTSTLSCGAVSLGRCIMHGAWPVECAREAQE